MRQVVLVGGGHSHVQVLRRWIMRPVPGVRLTVVVDRPVAVYSGMVPALVAGELPRHALEIDVRPLARRAGARVVVAAAVRVDATARRVHVAGGRPPIPYDVCSLNIGSTVAATHLPGVADHAVPTRPIVDFLERLEARMPALRARKQAEVIVVGAGAGGVELAATVGARLSREGVAARVTLVSTDPDPLPGQPPAVVELVKKQLVSRGIGAVTGHRAVEVRADAVVLDDGRELASDLTLWVTGAVAPPLARDSGLPVDERGFLHVRSTLQVLGHDDLFAVGDCALLVDHPWVPRAGVYAVREGPVVAANLEAWLSGRPLKPYEPQTDFLSMLNLGDRRAVVAKWGRALHGRWVWRWKHRIDRRFMERFQVLAADGTLAAPFARALPPMSGDDMVCGGCAAKVDARALGLLLGDVVVDPPGVRAGLGARDDAAAVELGSGVVAATVDGFTPFTDDPWLVGRIAAVNAANDLRAKGVAPAHALALLRAPADDLAGLAEAMAGLRAGLDREGAVLVGGHTATGPDLFLGLTVLGDAAPRWWSLSGARAGDGLVLTGPLGTGLLWRADALGRAAGPWIEALVASSCAGQRAAFEALASAQVHAATDVSGFGLAGHLHELLEASDLSADLYPDAVPRYPGVDVLLREGVRSTAHPGNAQLSGVQRGPHLDPVRIDIVYDPQTAGPLLLCVPDAASVVEDLRRVGCEAAVVGRVRAARTDGVRLHILAGTP